MLKSYRLKTTLKKKKRKKKPTRDLITGAVGATIGLAFVSQTAKVFSTL